MAVIGYATLQVIPSMRGAQAAMSRQMAPIAGTVGKGAGAAMGASMAGAAGAQRNLFQRAGARIGQSITAPIPVAARNAFRAVGTHAATAGAAIGTHIGGNADRASRKVQGIGSSFRGMAKFAGAAMAAVGLAGFVGDIGRVATGAQKTQASLDAMYQASGHGAGEAKRATGLLFDEFGRSSLGLGAFQSGAETLAYLGLNAGDSVGVMKFLENSILATGGSADNMRRVTEALTSAQNRGKATMMELNRISQAGVPILDMLSAHLGVTTGEVMEMASSGEISVDDLTTVLLEVPGKWGPALNDAADEVRKTLPVAMSSARQSIVNGIARGILPALDALAPVVTRVSGKIADAFEAFPTLLDRAAGAVNASGLPDFFARIMDTVRPALPLVGRFVGIFAGLKVAAGLVSGVGIAFAAVGKLFLANPVVLALAAIIAGFTYAWQNSERFRDIVRGAMDAVGSAVSWLAGLFGGGGGLGGAMETVRGIADRVVGAFRSGGAVFEWVSDLVAKLRPRFSAIGDSLSSVWQSVQPVVQWIGERLPGAFSTMWGVAEPIVRFLVRLIGDTLSNAIDGVVQVFQGAVRAIGGILDIFAGLFTGDWSRMWQGVKDVAAGIFGAIVGAIRTWLTVTIFRVVGSAFTAIRGLFTTSWNAIRGIFTGAGRSLVQTVRGWSVTIRLRIMYAMDAVRAGITSVWQAITGFFSRTLSNLRSAISNAFTAMRNTVRSIMDTIRLQIGTVLSIIRTAWNNGWTAIRTFLRNAWDAMRNLVRDRIAAVRTNITNVVSSIRDTWSRIWGSVRDTFSRITGNVRDRARTIMDTVRGTFQRGIDRVKDIFNSLAGTVRGALNSARNAAASGLNRVIRVINRMIGGVNRVSSALGLGNILGTISEVSTGGSVTNTAGRLFATAHEGGVVGSQLPETGGPLRPGERMVKALDGEEVLTEDDPRHVANIGHFGSNVQPAELGGPLARARAAAGRVVGRVKDAASSVWSSVRGLIADTVRPLVRRLKESAASRAESMGPIGRIVAGASNQFADNALRWISGVDAEAKSKEDEHAMSSGSSTPGTASLGGSGTVLARLVRSFQNSGIPGRFTSGFRPGDRGLHGRRRAADFAGPSPSARPTPAMGRIFDHFARMSGLRELIYNGRSWNILSGRRIPIGSVSAGLRAQHNNHVHVGMAGGAWVPRTPGGVQATIGEGRHAELVAPEPMLRTVIREEAGPRGDDGSSARPIQVTVNSHDTTRVARDLDDVLGWHQRVAAGWGS